MKTFCRILACVLAVIMLVTVFAACGTTTDPKPTESKTAETPTKQDTPTEPATATPSVEQPTGEDTPTADVTPTPDEPVNTLPKILKSETEAVENFATADGPMEILFYVNGGEWGSLATRSISVAPDPETGDQPDMTFEPNLKTQERNDTIKNLIGTDIVVKKVGTMQGTAAELKPLLVSQEHVYDVVVMYQYFDLGLALGDTVGSFYNLERMPEGYTNYININADYWNKQIYDTMKLRDPDSGNSVCFFLTGDATQTNIGNMFVSYVNQRMWDDYKDKIKDLESSGGYSDIYDIVNNGYWTMDLWIDLANLCWQDKNANQKPDNEDQLGVLLYGKEGGINNMSVEWLTYGAGVRYTELDDQGLPVAACNSTHNMAAFKKIYDLYCSCNTGTMKYIDDTEDEKNYILDFFARGNILATVNELKMAEEHLLEMTDDYYIMPLPMMDHEQFNPEIPSLGYLSGLGDSLSHFALLVYGGDERIPALTATLELMGYFGKKLVTPSYYTTTMKYRIARDPRNGKMLDTIHEGIYSCFGFIWSANLMNLTWKIRENYADLNNLADNWKQINKSTKGSLKKLMTLINTAWFVQS